MPFDLEKLFHVPISQFKFHLVQYVDLYTKPFLVYKKIVSIRKTSYNLVLYHILYYIAFVTIFLEIGFNKLLMVTTIDVILVVIPFVPLALVWLPVVKASKLRTPVNRLFRLMLIIKLQLIPIVLLLVLAYKFFKSESIFIVVENFIGFIILCYYIIPPLVVKVKTRVKFLWVACNYLVFNVWVVIVIFVVALMPRPERDKVISKVGLETPNNEWLQLTDSLKGAYFDLSYDQYMVSFDTNRVGAVAVIPVTTELENSFGRQRRNQAFEVLGTLDTVTYSHWRDSLHSVGLTISRLDSFRIANVDMLETDLRVSSRQKDSCRYESNRDFFKALYAYLRAYKNTRYVGDSISSFLSKEKPMSIMLPESAIIVTRYRHNSQNLFLLYNQVLVKYDFALERSKQTTLLLTIAGYPLELMLGGTSMFDSI